MPHRPVTTINTSRCTKGTSTARQGMPNLLSHDCSANGSTDGNQLAATHNPRFPPTLLLVSHLYARSAPVVVWLRSIRRAHARHASNLMLRFTSVRSPHRSLVCSCRFAIRKAAIAAIVKPCRERIGSRRPDRIRLIDDQVRAPGKFRRKQAPVIPFGQPTCSITDSSNALIPFQAICTPIQTRKKDDNCVITVMPVAPRIRANRSANP